MMSAMYDAPAMAPAPAPRRGEPIKDLIVNTDDLMCELNALLSDTLLALTGNDCVKNPEKEKASVNCMLDSVILLHDHVKRGIETMLMIKEALI